MFRVKDLVRRLVRLVNRFLGDQPTNADYLQLALTSLLAHQIPLRILQIGANDGLGGDPLSAFVSRYPGETRLLLCEPQPELASLLRKNYEWHPDVTVFEGGVHLQSASPYDQSPELWRVRPGLWDRIESRYTRINSIPSFRAVSGFASSDKTHVERHLRNYRYKGANRRVDPDEAIEQVNVRWFTVSELVAQFPDFMEIDVLVIDVEGMDDKVVLSAIEGGLFPTLIFFEIKHLGQERFRYIQKLLLHNRYVVTHVGSNALAIRGPLDREERGCADTP